MKNIGIGCKEKFPFFGSNASVSSGFNMSGVICSNTSVASRFNLADVVCSNASVSSGFKMTGVN
jgi:hypothetical protein